MKATWNGVVIAESDKTRIIEGNHYFPPESVKPAYLRATDTHTRCYWKGRASYYDVVVGDAVNHDAAWHYPETSKLAQAIKGYVAFWRGVSVA